MSRLSLLQPLVAGGLLALAFPRFGFFPLAWVALIPFLDFLVGDRKLGKLLTGHLLFGAGFFGILLYWIPRVMEIYGGLDRITALGVFLLLVALLTTLLLPFSLVLQGISRISVPAALTAAPALWTLTEWAENYIPFGGFPWSALGYSQTANTYVVQVADLGSVYAVSFLVVFVNSAFLLAFRHGRWTHGALAAAALCLVTLYSSYRIHIWQPVVSERLRVAVAQPDIELMRERDYYAKKYFQTLARLFEEGVDRGARWMIFPEAQNPFRYPGDFYFREFWESKVRENQVYLLFNSTTARGTVYFNSAHLLGASGEASLRYDKTRLVPFGEYLPLDWLLGEAETLVAEVSQFTPGEGMTLGSVEGVPFATLICYEAIFPDLSREGVRLGAEILVNLTNDRWFGDTSAPYQHFEIARMRAIEFRKPLIRAANSGISALVTPKGEVRDRTQLFEEALLVGSVEANREVTLFARFGFLPLIGLIMVSLLGAIRIWKKERSRR